MRFKKQTNKKKQFKSLPIIHGYLSLVLRKTRAKAVCVLILS